MGGIEFELEFPSSSATSEPLCDTDKNMVY